MKDFRKSRASGLADCASENDSWKGIIPLLLGLCLAAGSPAWAGPVVRFQHLSTGDGLSQGTVHRILQDRQGFMWFATDDGLNRFDGYSFRTYRSTVDTPGSLGSSVVFDVAEDGQGRLWVAAWGGGLNLFDRESERFTVFRTDGRDSGSLGDNRVNCLLPDPDGGIWVGTEGGLDYFDPESGRFTHFLHRPGDPASLSDNWITCLCLDRNGAMWVGTQRGLNRFDRHSRTCTRFLHAAADPASLPHDHVSAVANDSNDRLWIGTRGGLCHLDRQSGVFVRFPECPGQPVQLGQVPVRSILEGQDGALWLGTLSGLFRQDRPTGRVDRFTHDPEAPQTLAGDDVIALGQDRSGVLWAGTRGQGLSTFQSGRLKFVPRRVESSGAATLEVFGILVDGGRIWLGTRAGLKSIGIRENSGPSSVGEELGAAFARVFAPYRALWEGRLFSVLHRDRSGTFWIGVREGGLFRLSLDGGRSAVYEELAIGNEPARGNSILEWYEDRAGIIWLGTDGYGLTRLDPRDDHLTSYRHDSRDPHSLGSDYVMSMVEDAAGLLWVGTWGGGISRLDRQSGKFDHLVPRPGHIRSLSHNIVTILFRDRRDTIWAGTYGGGLNRYQPRSGNFDRFTTRDGLANDIVCGILEDSRGDLWISTYGGVSRFHPETGRFTNYTSADGLQSDEFNIRARARGPDGLLIFGGTRGVNAFRPEEIGTNSFVPPVVFTGYRRLTQGGVAEERGFVGEGEIRLSYRDSLTLGFAALDYTNPLKNQYAYRLEGSNTDWILLGPRHEITFANLAPGGYTLLVKGSNDEGIWNEQGASVAVIVAPPFYQTAWFRLAMAGLAAGLLLCVYRAWASRQRERTKLKLLEGELSVAERIQCSMLPNVFPPFPDRDDVDVFARMIPARHVGGDFYDFYLVSPGRLGFAIGDVSGKGVPAAMQMSMCRVLLKGAAGVGRPVWQVAEIVNNILAEELPSNTFITAFLGILELSTGRLEYVRAGQNPPAVVRTTGEVVILEEPVNYFLGKFPKVPFEPGTVVLDPKDTLVLYTDGLSEAPGHNGAMLGDDEERLHRLLASVAGRPLRASAESILEEVERYSLGIPQSDDRTLMLIRFRP